MTDPKGLIRESYNIEGITAGECRSIFLDWALSLPAEAVPAEALAALLEHYEDANPGHPMNTVLRDGLAAADSPVRRGGGAARVPPA
ncbi:hypothetical protein [Oceaniglobus roseus]|uniref:hypothetical protein n=1 Tax=Oceaniglobus roseus TaxID=1737570 RepID=UPI000C7F3178|nr:hypothetical protein [Kandeliimicrobium roseum]